MTQERDGWEPNISEGTYLPVSSMAMLAKLGVNTQIERAGSVLRESRVLSDKGGVFGRVDLSALAKSYGAPAVGIGYRQLLRVRPPHHAHP